MNWLRKLWADKPFILIMGAAILSRLVAVIWARGFGMHDDHFLVIEAAQSWVDGRDYNNWLPNAEGTNTPAGHSFLYPGLHYYLFLFLEWTGFRDPGSKMLIVRLLHAVFSLATVWIGYRFAKRYTSQGNANLVGLLLAVYWFMPWLSVRNLVEVVCIPFLMAGVYLAVVADEEEQAWYRYVLPGILLGLAFSIRYQTILFSGGVILALWLHRRWLGGIIAGLSYLFIAVLIQGIPDYLIWGEPFVELLEYIRYNLTHAGDYIQSPWYTYLLLIGGIMIPPISLYLMAGLLAAWRKHLLVFLPVMIFLVFHSLFPNKQERFILPLIPFIIMAGVSGWEQLNMKWKAVFEGKRFRSAWIFFWVINLALLPLISTTYSKRARVEAMRHLAAYPDVRTILLDERPRHGIKYPPQFYLGQWTNVIERDKAMSLDRLKERVDYFAAGDLPRFVLFSDDKDLVERVHEIQEILPGIVFEQRVRPSLIDAILHSMNPNNANESIIIYRNTTFFPDAVVDDEQENSPEGVN